MRCALFLVAVTVAGLPAPAPAQPARRLRLVVVPTTAKAPALLDAASAPWSTAPPTRVLLNRTPRVFATDPVKPRAVPGLEVRALASPDGLLLRLEWDDATRNAPRTPPRRTGKGGDPERLSKRPTGETTTFSDAAAVMVPEKWDGGAFPPLQMGGKHAPTTLYYWSASGGTEQMKATGRATPAPVGKGPPHRAGHAAGKWVLTLHLPALADGTPVAFAVWDGEEQDRDGSKFFSIWYVLTGK